MATNASRPEWPIDRFTQPGTAERPAHLKFEYDPLADVLTVEGIRYSGGLFRAWAKDGLRLNERFEIVQRSEDGAITIGVSG